MVVISCLVSKVSITVIMGLTYYLWDLNLMFSNVCSRKDGTYFCYYFV